MEDSDIQSIIADAKAVAAGTAEHGVKQHSTKFVVELIYNLVSAIESISDDRDMWRDKATDLFQPRTEQ